MKGPHADPWLARIRQLVVRKPSDTYRIPVLEVDPSQADFAAAILGKADMQIRTVTQQVQVLSSMEAFRPDLILMDLYMPEADGAELTKIIRIKVVEKMPGADNGIISALIRRVHQYGTQVIVPRVDDPKLIGQQWVAAADFVQGDAIRVPREEPDYDFSEALF
jgi:CheY-like chemotaxis protein